MAYSEKLSDIKAFGGNVMFITHNANIAFVLFV